MTSAIGFQCPYFHLAETLSSKLSFTAKGLLCNQRVWTGGTGMYFIFNQVNKLHHINYSHGYGLIKLLTGLPVLKGCFAKSRRCLFLLKIYFLHNFFQVFIIFD